MFSMGNDSHGYEFSRTGRKFSLDVAPGYEGADAKPDDIFELQMSPETLHKIGAGLEKEVMLKQALNKRTTGPEQ